jgi:hypothetical protein
MEWQHYSDKQMITRKDAAATGAKRYYTGKVCRNGHIAERDTDTGNCCECQKASANRYMKKYRKRRSYLEYQREYQRNYRKTHK